MFARQVWNLKLIQKKDFNFFRDTVTRCVIICEENPRSKGEGMVVSEKVILNLKRIALQILNQFNLFFMQGLID